MIVKISLAGLKETRWYEFALRFLIGGLITAAAGLVSKRFGPGIGGLFLAFPAVFPATATLIAKHERQKKSEQGLRGERRGLEAAAVDACGSALGSLGLVTFALVSWWLLQSKPAAVAVGSATAAWIAIAGAAWCLRRIRHRKTARQLL